MKLIEIKKTKNVIFVEDTHGDLEASQKVIKDYLKPGNKIVFLGDYVDRGEKSKEILDFLLETKLKYPHQLFLLQGNHGGDKEFLKIEEKRNLELLPLKKCVLAPGGSIVYLKKLMKALKESSLIIFLDRPLWALEKRLTNKETRGIVGFKSKSIKKLYKERVPLYEKYADIVINCFQKSDNEIVQEIIKNLND